MSLYCDRLLGEGSGKGCEGMTCDFMGAKQRAWVFAGGEWFFDEAIAMPELIVVEGQVPVVALPACVADDAPRLEVAFGWAMAELTEQSCGWLAMCGIVRRRVAALAAAAGILAAGLGAAALVACGAAGALSASLAGALVALLT